MTQDDFERNFRSQYAQHMKRRADGRVKAGSPPRETGVTFEHYEVGGVELVLLLRSETKDDVRLFLLSDMAEAKRRIDAALPDPLAHRKG